MAAPFVKIARLAGLISDSFGSLEVLVIRGSIVFIALNREWLFSVINTAQDEDEDGGNRMNFHSKGLDTLLCEVSSFKQMIWLLHLLVE